MAISPEDRRRWESQVRSLKLAETDDEGTPEFRARRIAEANEWRTQRGLPLLRDEFEGLDEAEFHRRARALGLARPLR